MLLEINGLRAGYGGKEVLKGLDCALDAGEVLCIVGPNGCGKTTAFRTILGSLRPTAGSVLLDGQPLDALPARLRAKRVAYIPQNHTPVFGFTVQEVVLMGRTSHFAAWQTPGRADRRAALDALEQMGLLALAGQSYLTLSGGQRQMVLIARAIAQAARLLIMDEPGASLDYANQQRLLDVVRALAARGYGVVMSTHNPEHPFAVAHKALLMEDGQAVAFGPPAAALTAQTLERAYGIPMDVLSATDRTGRTHTFCVPVQGGAP